MPLRWKFFRTICIVQLLLACFFALKLILTFFRSVSFTGIAGLLLFTAIMFLCVLGMNLVNNNYPDEPVQDAQKKTFNRVFLLNFLFLSFSFGFVLSEYRELKQLAALSGQSLFDLPFDFFITLIAYMLMLLLQLAILYGLYKLRLELYSNFMKRKFDFENQ